MNENIVEACRIFRSNVTSEVESNDLFPDTVESTVDNPYAIGIEEIESDSDSRSVDSESIDGPEDAELTFQEDAEISPQLSQLEEVQEEFVVDTLQHTNIPLRNFLI